jgi:ligand-binding SRPBCC domain-containing protein
LQNFPKEPLAPRDTNSLASSIGFEQLRGVETFFFEASTPVTASPEALFAFHENPANIRLIAPPSLKLASVESAERAVVGGEFRIRARQFGLPIDWTGRWEVVEPPVRLVDVGVRSPFALWRHSHCFRAEGAGAVMTDRVEYVLSGGVAGRWMSALLLPFVFAGMFRARHRATRRYFAQ